MGLNENGTFLQVPVSPKPNALMDSNHEPMRVALWNKQLLVPVYGDEAPLIEDLFPFLEKHPQYEIFRCQDEIIERKGEELVPIWDTISDLRLPTANCPARKNLHSYLSENCYHKVYRGQDGLVVGNGYRLVHSRYLLSNLGKVVIWDPLNICRVDETNCPSFYHLKRFLSQNPELEVYTDQGEFMPEPRSAYHKRRVDRIVGERYKRNKDDIYLSIRGTVLLWNKNSGRKWSGQGAPTPQELEEFLARKPHYDPYDGQDVLKTYRR